MDSVVPDKKRKSNEIDMLNGSLPKGILLFSLPLAASSILQQLFNSADVAVVGRFAGKMALAAVGSNATVTALFVNVFVGLSVGVNVTIAKLIGQQKKSKVPDAVHTAMTFALLCGIILLIVGQIIARPLLAAIDTPKNVLDQAVVYLRIYFIGMPFIIIYNFGSAVLRSVGDTKRPLYCLTVSGVVNVILNLIFVIEFKMGVAGVALATTIANLISATMVVIILSKEDSIINFDIKKTGIKGSSLASILVVGAPSALQVAVFSLSNVLIQTGINSFGEDGVGGSSTALNFEYFTFFVISAFSQAAVTFTSQNFGAGKYDRCRKVCRICMLEGMLLTIMMSTTFIMFGDFFVRLYTLDEAVIAYALIRMTHVMAIEFMTGSYEISGASLRGLGHSLLPALLTVLGSVVFRIIWLYTVFAKHHSFGMLMTVYPVSWVLTGTMVLTAYFIISRKVYAN